MKELTNLLNPTRCYLDGPGFFMPMQITEKEIEDIIFQDLTENYGTNLCERGLVLPFQTHSKWAKVNRPFNIKWVRQLNIQPYGILDIVGFYRHKGSLYAELIELKACQIEVSHFDQIFRYKKGLEVYARQTFKDINFNVSCTLIGNGYNTGCYIQNNCEIVVSEYKYGLAGFEFETHLGFGSWAVTNDDNCNFRNLIKPPLVRIKPGIHNGKTFY